MKTIEEMVERIVTDAIPEIEEKIEGLAKDIRALEDLADAAEDILSDNCPVTRARLAQVVELFRERCPKVAAPILKAV